jgi:hypothetical protein
MVSTLVLGRKRTRNTKTQSVLACMSNYAHTLWHRKGRKVFLREGPGQSGPRAVFGDEGRPELRRVTAGAELPKRPLNNRRAAPRKPSSGRLVWTSFFRYRLNANRCAARS